MIFLKKLIKFLDQKTEYSSSQFIMLGILGAINFPIYYFVWRDTQHHQLYENMGLRLIGFFLCVLLILKNYWPRKLKFYLSLYWYAALIYTIPFFLVFMYLKNDASTDWLITVLWGFFLLVLVTDWLMFLIISCIGISISILSYVLTTPFPKAPSNGLLFYLIYIIEFVLMTLVSQSKEWAINEKLKTLLALSGSIAHELRTPLFAIRSGLRGLKRYFPLLLESYKKAKEAKLPIKEIPPTHREALFSALETVENEANYADTIINMLLMRVNQKQIDSESFEICSVTQCILHAVERYPFASRKQRKLVHLGCQIEFSFNGKELLVEHILFNLIKNALYYIQAAGKGEIYIWTTSGKSCNFLHFRDTGKGIPARLLPKLFTKFFTTSNHGTGLGLAFCKTVMHSFKGDIVCDSVENEFTEFVLSFPKLENPIIKD